MNMGLLVLRLVLGLLLVGHGSQKLFGLFGGPGLAGAGGFFHSLGFRPGRPMAIVAGASEAGTGVLLVLGLHALAGNRWGVAALVVGALSGLAVVARGRRALAADATAQSVAGENVPA